MRGLATTLGLFNLISEYFKYFDLFTSSEESKSSRLSEETA